MYLAIENIRIHIHTVKRNHLGCFQIILIYKYTNPNTQINNNTNTQIYTTVPGPGTKEPRAPPVVAAAARPAVTPAPTPAPVTALTTV